MNHSKTILILLNGQAIYVGSSTVRVLEVKNVDIDEDELARLANRVSDRGCLLYTSDAADE